MSTQTHKYIYICITILMYEYDVFYSGYIYTCVFFLCYIHMYYYLFIALYVCVM